MSDPSEARIPYAPAARARIIARGFADLHHFLDHPRPQLSKALHSRRPVDGFRRGTKAAAREQIRRLIISLLSPSTKDTDWAFFEYLWLLRVADVFPEQSINDDIKAYNKERWAGAPADALSRLIDRMRELVGATSVSREAVQELLSCSPMTNQEDIEGIVSLALPLEEVLRRRLLAEVPEELRRVHAELSTIRHDLDAFKSDFVSIERDATAHNQRITSLSDSLGDIAEDVKRLKASLGKAEEALTMLSSAREHGVKEITALRRDISGTIARLNALQTELHIESEVRGSAEDDLKRDIDALAARIGSTAVRAVPMAHGGDNSPDQTIPGAEADTANASMVRQATAVWPDFALASAEGRERRSLEALPAFLTLFADNARALGVSSDSATRMAVEVAAGLLAGQIISFAGSMAGPVTAACVCTLGFEPQVFSPPIGLTDDGVLNLRVRSLFDAQAPGSTFVLRGANRSAFELYGGALRNAVIARQIGEDPNPHVYLLAVVEDGPAVLRLNVAFAELGPIIDTDIVKWRMHQRAGEKPVRGRLEASLRALLDRDDLGAVGPGLSDAGHTASLDELLSAVGVKPSIVFRRTLEAAVRFLQVSVATQGTAGSTGEASQQTAIFESAVVSWLIPYLRSHALSPKTIIEKIHALNSAELFTEGRVSRALQHWTDGR